MFNLESNYVVKKCHGRLQNQSRKGNRGKFKVPKEKMFMEGQRVAHGISDVNVD